MDDSLLLENLNEQEKQIKTDNYSMSIRELMSMFEDGQINLEPIYQRIYRWDEFKASKLIESIFLGMPIPSIFVSVRKGKWDVVDGVQRISSLLWFYGKVDKIKKEKKLKLTGLEKLTTFNNLEINDIPFELKFEKLDLYRINIILLKSESIDSEYELFNRLNSGGIELSAQEIRNFLIVKLNKNLFEELDKFKEKTVYKNVISISPNQVQKAYDLELLVYALILSRFKKYRKEYEEFAKQYYTSRERFIDECIKHLLKDEIELNTREELTRLENKFEQLYKVYDTATFKKGIQGKFSPGLFVTIMVYMYNDNPNVEKIKEEILKSKVYAEFSKRGINVVKQFIELANLGLELYEVI